jgi:hypothetical protein
MSAVITSKEEEEEDTSKKNQHNSYWENKILPRRNRSWQQDLEF